MKLALASITSSYLLFLNLVSKALNERLFAIETTKKFNEVNFLNDVKNYDFSLKTGDLNEKYDFSTTTAPLMKRNPRKEIYTRMNRNPRKEIYTRSRFRNKFCKTPTKENEKPYKKQRSKCVALRRKCMKEYFHNKADNNIVTNNNF